MHFDRCINRLLCCLFEFGRERFENSLHVCVLCVFVANTYHEFAHAGRH
jgi:hypothetical protein